MNTQEWLRNNFVPLGDSFLLIFFYLGAIMDRKIILLKATYELLKKCDEGPFVKNVMEETVFYDDTECDGYCLMEDIETELGLDEFRLK